jgi:predicted ATPase
MSPGKKGLILLFLILHLSNADYPILIDQPEDNLDNRTVYTELKDFMKKKKIERQILIVTHNANLVVTTDAENVIVANQDGQDQGNENETYHFEYDSGALEDSFRDQNALGVLNKMGIKEHVCEILEGGEAAFIEREKRYALSEL